MFIPCVNGISHSSDEKASYSDIVKASRVLLDFLHNYSVETKETKNVKKDGALVQVDINLDIDSDKIH